MKIKRFNEKYELDNGGNIGEEYANLIISHYIDNVNDGGTLQDSFDFYCKEDLEEDLRHIVVSEIHSLINRLSNSIKRLYFTDDDYLSNDANKYNV